MRGRDDGDRGAAMVVALGALLVMSLLAALAAQASTRGNDAANVDVRSKLALQAAEAGLQTATYRMNMLRPAPARRVTSAVVDPVAGVCPEQGPEEIGNGASYRYRTSAGLGPDASCAGMRVQAQTALSQRCVTSTGVADGVVRRVQARVASYASTPLFPVPGILGLTSVALQGNVAISGAAATNGTMSLDGNVSVGGVLLGPSAPPAVTRGNVTSGGITSRTPAQGPFVLANVDPGNSATVNDNGRIANGLRVPPAPPFDAVATGSALTYDPTTRALRSVGNSTLTLGGGVYNFCSIAIAGNLTLVVAPGARVSIYVDSPDDPNGRCPAGSGGLSVGGNFSSGTAASDPTALQLFVYDSNDRRNDVTIRGNSTLYATLYAPQSTVSVAGNARLFGAIAASAVTVSGNGVQYDQRAGGLQVGSEGLYYRTAWRECAPRPPNAADPTSGC